MQNTKKTKSKKKRKTRKGSLFTKRQAAARSYEMFFDVDRKTINVNRKDFEIYVKGIKENLFTPFAWDNELARRHTGLSPDQLMFIKINFIKLARDYNFDMNRQEFLKEH